MSDIENKKYGNEKGNTDKKRAIVLKEHRNKIKPLLVVIILLSAIAVGAASYFSLITPKGQNATAHLSSPPATESHGDKIFITYDLKTFSDGSAKHFHYDNNGQKINYFILKSSDGVIRSAFNACDVCWPSGKGYYQDKDEMVCRNCGMRFISTKINEVQGGCNPAPLKREVRDNKLFIKIEDILEGKRYFDFS